MRRLAPVAAQRAAAELRADRLQPLVPDASRAALPAPRGRIPHPRHLRDQRTVVMNSAPQQGTPAAARARNSTAVRSEEHTSELQSLMRISYAVFCLKKTNNKA